MNNRPEKILLSASGPKTTRSYLSLIRESQMGMISTCESARESWKALEFEAFSIVIIISPLMDGDGYELAKQASKTAAGVLFVTTQERYEDAVSHLRGSGVCVFSTAMGRRLFHQSLEMLEAVHIRLSRQVPQEQMPKASSGAGSSDYKRGCGKAGSGTKVEAVDKGRDICYI